MPIAFRAKKRREFLNILEKKSEMFPARLAGFGERARIGGVAFFAFDAKSAKGSKGAKKGRRGARGESKWSFGEEGSQAELGNEELRTGYAVRSRAGGQSPPYDLLLGRR